MACCGRRSPSRCWAMATGAASCSSMLNPINHADDPHRHAPLPGRALCRLRRRLFDAAACRARRLDLVHRLGRHGCIASRSNGCWASACRATNLADRSLHPAQLAGLRDHVPLSAQRATRSRSKTRSASAAASSRSSSTARAVTGNDEAAHSAGGRRRAHIACRSFLG